MTTRTIRHYEDQGLIAPAAQGSAHASSAHATGSASSSPCEASAWDSPSQEIKELFDLYDLSKDERQQLEVFLEKLDKRKALLEQQREDIEVMLNEVEFFAAQCRRLLASGSDMGRKQAA